jgi:hypothetical protein
MACELSGCLWDVLEWEGGDADRHISFERKRQTFPKPREAERML